MSCPKCPASQVIDPPKVIYKDVYHPQLVQIVHPIEIVTRHHCIPIPQHIPTVVVKDECCPPSLSPVAHIKKMKKKRRTKR
ncbi:hypothetical protein [Paenibacillus xerothermodurans]|uniref:Spore coat protein D n=1 Tax=Paenibacillus xerothermodurans TaxID=1977292 RepID=A0A2W1N684_PAEXE|nr:hypothetical protein [Paenibacillus xerothermodurans]PZE20159.1 hypothetical protein CBW46_014820 [Paenibacillus xerothermodurans]